jgi:hypothetical protein
MKNRRLPRSVGCGMLALLPACGSVLLGDAGGTASEGGGGAAEDGDS